MFGYEISYVGSSALGDFRDLKEEVEEEGAGLGDPEIVAIEEGDAGLEHKVEEVDEEADEDDEEEAVWKENKLEPDLDFELGSKKLWEVFGVVIAAGGDAGLGRDFWRNGR